MKPVILVVDDETAIRLFLEATLEDEGYEVLTAANGQEAYEHLDTGTPDLVLLDVVLPDASGMDILKKIKKNWPHLCVVMVTAYHETDNAVQAIKMEAYDYINKPIQLERLLKVVSAGLDASEEKRKMYRRTNQSDLFGSNLDMVPSSSEGMLEIYDTIRKISSGGTTTVLIEGESGVGKDVIANLIHKTSVRQAGPFLEINCAALPEQLLESELFGHEKGAFTDAVNQKLGLLELAHSGTVFLDEIGEMSLPVQVKMLRVLEKTSFRRIGGIQDISVDVRLVAATNRNLAAQVKAGSFREDLYYRLKVVQLMVPPLRSRKDDIQPLAEFFMERFNTQFGKNFDNISKRSVAMLKEHHWPGNIRELKNMVERTVLLQDGPTLLPEYLRLAEDDHAQHDLPLQLQELLVNPLPEDGFDLDALLNELEGVLVRKAYSTAGGNQSKAARLLGINRDKFRYRFKQHGEI